MRTVRLVTVDDAPSVSERIGQFLPAGYEVLRHLSSGEELLARASTLDADVVLLDITMPGLDGIETARRLTSSAAPLEIVFVTVHEDPELVREALEAGAKGYVVKSRVVSDLETAIVAALEGRCFVSPTIPAAE